MLNTTKQIKEDFTFLEKFVDSQDLTKHLDLILPPSEHEKSTSKTQNSLFSYLILESLWFYQSIIEQKSFSKKNIKKKSKILENLKELEKNYGFQIFPKYLINKLPEKLILKILSTYETIKDEHFSSKNEDTRGLIFQNFLPKELRRITGSYHTRYEAAELLALLTINDSKQTILDLACGSGKLLTASQNRLEQLSTKKSDVSKQLFGFDKFPTAARLSTINLSLANNSIKSEINVGISNSLFLKPNEKFKALKSTKSQKTPKSVDILMMNPPFTRQELISKKEKALVSERFKKYEKIIDKKFGLHAYFVLLANEFLKEGGKLAFVLPATILRIESLTNLRKLLVENFEIEMIVSSNEKSSFSDGSSFREILLIAKKTKTPKKSHKVKIISLSHRPSSSEEISKIHKLIHSSSIKKSTILSRVDVNQETLQKNHKNLFKFLALHNSELVNYFNKIFASKLNLIPFENFSNSKNSKIIRGWETLRSEHPTQSNYIMKNSDEVDEKSPWYLENKTTKTITAKNSITKKSCKIPSSCIKFGLRRLGKIDTINVENNLDLLISKKFSGINKFHNKKIIENFSEWEKILKTKTGNLAFVRRFNISGPNMKVVAIVSDHEFTPSQTLTIFTNISNDESKILSLWLNSSFHIFQMIIERIETEGSYMELPEWAMKKLFVIDMSKISEEDKIQLLDLYSDIQNTVFPSLVEQFSSSFETRQKIDELFLSILKIQVSLPKLHSLIKNELLNLKKINKI